jgi:hypothetical protein
MSRTHVHKTSCSINFWTHMVKTYQSSITIRLNCLFRSPKGVVSSGRPGYLRLNGFYSSSVLVFQLFLICMWVAAYSFGRLKFEWQYLKHIYTLCIVFWCPFSYIPDLIIIFKNHFYCEFHCFRYNLFRSFSFECNLFCCRVAILYPDLFFSVWDKVFQRL